MALTMLDTQLIYIGDRESDIVVMMRRARDMGHPADWLVRSQQNRTLLGGGKLRAQATTGEAWGEIEFSLAARPGQTACHVRQYVLTRAMEIPDGAGGVLNVTCVVAKEMNLPMGCKAVEWRLLTNRTVTVIADAVEPIDWYHCRLEIEFFFNRPQKLLPCGGTATGQHRQA